MSSLKFLEVLHALVQDQFQSKEDCLVTALHCMMINKGNKCVGTGDTWNPGSDLPSDVLPEGWNSNQEIYTLRYTCPPNIKYLVKIIKANDSLLVNVLDVDKNNAAGWSVKTENHVTDDFKSFASAYQNLDKMQKDFQDNISKAVKLDNETPDNPGRKANKVTGKERPNEPDDPLPEERYADPAAASNPFPRVAFPPVGGNDLDPMGGYFGGGGGSGGMILDPSNMNRPVGPRMPDLGLGGPQRLPRGAVPPGARFDPFGPPSLGRGGRHPHPDDMPPGFYDSFI